MERSIVVGLDGSAFAERALPFAAAIAERRGARLVLVRAAPAETVVEAHDYLRRLAEPSRGLGGRRGRPALETQAHEGEPAAVLLEEGRRRGADLLVLVTHGRSGLGRWRYGCVAEPAAEPPAAGGRAITTRGGRRAPAAV